MAYKDFQNFINHHNGEFSVEKNKAHISHRLHHSLSHLHEYLVKQGYTLARQSTGDDGVEYQMQYNHPDKSAIRIRQDYHGDLEITHHNSANDVPVLANETLAAPLVDPDKYEWHVWNHSKGAHVSTTNGLYHVHLKRGTEFGIRESSDRTKHRLITKEHGPGVVFSLSHEMAQAIKAKARKLPVPKKVDSSGALLQALQGMQHSGIKTQREVNPKTKQMHMVTKTRIAKAHLNRLTKGLLKHGFKFDSKRQIAPTASGTRRHQYFYHHPKDKSLVIITHMPGTGHNLSVRHHLTKG